MSDAPKEPKFIREMRAKIAAWIVPDAIYGANSALDMVAQHYRETPMLNPAQVGYKRITPIRINYEAKLQKLANELAHEKEARQKAESKLANQKPPKPVSDPTPHTPKARPSQELADARSQVGSLRNTLNDLRAELDAARGIARVGPHITSLPKLHKQIRKILAYQTSSDEDKLRHIARAIQNSESILAGEEPADWEDKPSRIAARYGETI